MVLFFKCFNFFSCGIDLGDNFVKRSTIDVDSIQKHAAKEAREAAERRHVKELKASLLRQQKQMEDDKLRCLKNQKTGRDLDIYLLFLTSVLPFLINPTEFFVNCTNIDMIGLTGTNSNLAMKSCGSGYKSYNNSVVLFAYFSRLL